MRRAPVRTALALLALGLPGAASAEYLVLQDGRSMQVSAYRFEGQVTRVELRSGGTMSFDSAMVSHVAPDEDLERAAVAFAALAAPPAGAATDWLTFTDARFIEPIQRIASRHDLDPALVAAVIKVESNFHPHAVSPKGAKGLMQLMPGTAAQHGVSDPFDAEANIEGGAVHLRGLIARYRGDLSLALAAYNAGQKAVDRAQGIPAFRETQSYVARVLAFAGRAAVSLN